MKVMDRMDKGWMDDTDVGAVEFEEVRELRWLIDTYSKENQKKERLAKVAEIKRKHGR